MSPQSPPLALLGRAARCWCPGFHRAGCRVLSVSRPAGWVERFEDECRRGPSQQFRKDVEPQVGPREQAPDRGADGDGRVEGRSRHLADGECASQDREPNSETEVRKSRLSRRPWPRSTRRTPAQT